MVSIRLVRSPHSVAYPIYSWVGAEFGSKYKVVMRILQSCEDFTIMLIYSIFMMAKLVLRPLLTIDISTNKPLYTILGLAICSSFGIVPIHSES